MLRADDGNIWTCTTHQHATHEIIIAPDPIPTIYTLRAPTYPLRSVLQRPTRSALSYSVPFLTPQSGGCHLKDLRNRSLLRRRHVQYLYCYCTMPLRADDPIWFMFFAGPASRPPSFFLCIDRRRQKYRTNNQLFCCVFEPTKQMCIYKLYVPLFCRRGWRGQCGHGEPPFGRGKGALPARRGA